MNNTINQPINKFQIPHVNGSDNNIINNLNSTDPNSYDNIHLNSTEPRVMMYDSKVKKFNKKSKKYKTLNENDLLQKTGNDFFSCIKSIYGSGMAQEYLTKCSNTSIIEFFEKIKGNLVDLTNNKYSNFLIQKLLVYLDFKHRLEFLEEIKNDIIQLCQDSYGSMAIQKLIQCMTTDQEEKILINHITNDYDSFVFDKNCMFVISKIIKHFNPSNLVCLFDFIHNNIVKIALDKNGIVILNNLLMIIKMLKLDNLRIKFISIISENFIELVTNKISYFCIICIVDNWDISEYLDLIKKFEENFEEIIHNGFVYKLFKRLIDLKNKDFNKTLCLNSIYSIKSYQEFFSNKISHKIFFTLLENLDNNTLKMFGNILMRNSQKDNDFKEFINKSHITNIDSDSRKIITQMINKIWKLENLENW
jgi:hypothetical protein